VVQGCITKTGRVLKAISSKYTNNSTQVIRVLNFAHISIKLTGISYIQNIKTTKMHKASWN